MFHHDEQTNNQSAPTLSGVPMNGVSDAADSTLPPETPASTPTGSVGAPAIVSPTHGLQPLSLPQSSDDLSSIKSQALAQLSPLVDKLDQTPEEKFRLTMTMIQASDDPSLVKTAYAAAEKIQDEKIRAEALLSIVNEVNYFSQKASSKPEHETPAPESHSL